MNRLSTLRVVALVGILGCAILNGPAAHGTPASNQLGAGSTMLNHRQVATMNIYGGVGNATKYFNGPATTYSSTNTVQSRMLARGSNLTGIGLQEVCEANYNLIVYELVAKGQTGGSNGFDFKFKATIGTGVPGSSAPTAACGSWFGNAVIIRGTIGSHSWITTFASQDPGGLGEKANAICAWTSVMVCTTHTKADNLTVAGAQSAEYRAMVNTWRPAALSAFATGDFNLEPTTSYMTAWAFDSFLDADYYNSVFDATTDSGHHFDYILRKNPPVWSADAYVSPAGWSDHHWKEGYY